MSDKETSLTKKHLIGWVNAAFITGTPVIALGLTAWYVPTHGIHWMEVVTFFFMYIASGLGITAGYHRCFSHLAYRTHPAVELFYLIFGAAAIENSCLK